MSDFQSTAQFYINENISNINQFMVEDTTYDSEMNCQQSQNQCNQSKTKLDQSGQPYFDKRNDLYSQIFNVQLKNKFDIKVQLDKSEIISQIGLDLQSLDKEMPFVLHKRNSNQNEFTDSRNSKARHIYEEFKEPQNISSPKNIFTLKHKQTYSNQQIQENINTGSHLKKRNFKEFISAKNIRTIKNNLNQQYGVLNENIISQQLFDIKENNEINSSECSKQNNTIYRNLFDISENNQELDTNLFMEPLSKRQKMHSEINSKQKDSSPTIYQRWLTRDSAFIGKYSNGTTPYQAKPLIKSYSINNQQIENIELDIKLDNQSPQKFKQFHQNKLLQQFSFKNQYQNIAARDSSPDKTQNPFKAIFQQIDLSRKPSEQDIDFKEIPDTPILQSKQMSSFNDYFMASNFRGSNITSSEATQRQQISRFQEDFKQVSVIGKGHFGKVIRGQNKLDQLEYAIKISTKKIKNEYEKSNFLQEVYALSALSQGYDNQHIVRYYSGWVEEYKLYIVMELCKQSLRENARKKKQKNQYFSENELKKIMRNICLGLQELHSRDIVHLDIKPENILESFNGNFKIGDLGLARLLSKVIEDNDIPEGDCRYMALELLNQDPFVPIPDLKKADTFALGMTIYELIEQKNLDKNGDEWQELREGMIEFSKKAQQIYSSELLDTVKQMLHQNPDLRPLPSDLLDTILLSEQEQIYQSVLKENEILKFKLKKLEMFLLKNGFDNIDNVIQMIDFNE